MRIWWEKEWRAVLAVSRAGSPVSESLLGDALRERVEHFFFFLAEVGIRGFHVTGVQTCALPIYEADRLPGLDLERHVPQRPDVERPHLAAAHDGLFQRHVPLRMDAEAAAHLLSDDRARSHPCPLPCWAHCWNGHHLRVLKRSPEPERQAL